MFFGYFFNRDAATNANGSLVVSREIPLYTCDEDKAIFAMRHIAHCVPAANAFTLYESGAKTGKVYNL